MNNPNCHDPVCDHKNCNKNQLIIERVVDFCKKNPTTVPAGILMMVGLAQGSVVTIAIGATALGIAFELDKIKTMIKNCKPWY